jgi:hypothetical protein
VGGFFSYYSGLSFTRRSKGRTDSIAERIHPNLCGEEQMEQKAPDLRKKIARYRRSLAVMNDPDTIKMIELMIKQTEEQIEAGERH